MKVLVIFLIFFIAISINESYAEMSYSEFQNFCKETENMNFDLMPVDQRLLASLCDFLELGLPEKYWDWIGSDLDWKNFAQNVSNEYAQEIPLFVEKGHKDSLIVNTSISGRDSFPPPMSAYISFYYDEDNKTKRFGEKYTVTITGEMIKTKDSRLPPLKLFDIGYHLDEIQCKQNLVLVQKYDGTPACVTESTKQKLIERGWSLSPNNTIKIKKTDLFLNYTMSNGVVKTAQLSDIAYAQFYYETMGVRLKEGHALPTEYSINLELNSPAHKGSISLQIPKRILDSLENQNDNWIIEIDNGTMSSQSHVKMEQNNSIDINYPAETNHIRIIGSVLE